MKVNNSKTSKSLFVIAAAGSLAAPLTMSGIMTGANAATVDYVTNVTSDKSIYNAGKEVSNYTVTVQNRSKNDADGASYLYFGSSINIDYDPNLWVITVNDSLGGTITPKITKSTNNDGKYNGFMAELPKLKAGEKLTFTIKADTAPGTGYESKKKNTVSARVDTSPDGSKSVDTDENTETSVSTISPQLVIERGSYGVDITPYVNAEDSSKPINGNRGKVSSILTLSNIGNVNETISTQLSESLKYSTSNDPFMEGSVKNITMECIENCQGVNTLANYRGGVGSEFLAPLDKNHVYTDGVDSLKTDSISYIKATLKAHQNVKYRILGEVHAKCGYNITLNHSARIFNATIKESDGDNENNFSSSTSMIPSFSCENTDLAVDKITMTKETEINGIKPWILSSDGSRVMKDGATSSFDVTYSNKGTTPQYVKLSENLDNEITHPNGVHFRIAGTGYNDQIDLPENNGTKSYEVISKTDGAYLKTINKYVRPRLSNQTYDAMDTSYIPAGGSITIRYNLMPITYENVCITRTDGPLTAQIESSNGSIETNKDNNKASLTYTAQGLTVGNDNPNCIPGLYDYTTTIEGMYSDPTFNTPITGPLVPGQTIYFKNRYTLTQDSSRAENSTVIKNDASIVNDKDITLNEAIKTDNVRILESNNQNLKYSKDASYEYLNGTWKAGDYVIIAGQFTIPKDLDCGTTDNEINVSSSIRPTNLKAPIEASINNNSAIQKNVLNIPQCTGAIAIDKKADEEVIGKDGKAKYTIKLTNTGDSDLNIARLVDVISTTTGAVTIDSIETTGGAIAPDKSKFQLGKDVDENGKITDANSSDGKVISLSWGSNDAGKHAMPAGSTVTIHMTAESTSTNSGNKNTATLKADDDDLGHFKAVTDDAYVKGILGQQLSITKKVSNSNPKPGEKITFTIDLTNYGDKVSDAYLRDMMNAHMLPTNKGGFTNLKCRKITASDNVLSEGTEVGNVECPEFKSDASGITAHIVNMESNSGLRLTYNAIAPTTNTSAANIAEFSNSSNVSAVNINDGRAQANLLVQSLIISGTVWHDADNSAKNTFNNIKTGDEKGINPGAGLSVVLVDGQGLVINTTKVNDDGTYSMDAPITAQGLSVALVPTTQVPAKGTAFDPKTQSQIVLGWANTTPLAHTSITTEYKDVTNLDFGVQQPPTVDDKTEKAQKNPGGTTQVQVPSLTGNDPEDGKKGEKDTFRIDTLPTNGTLYYDGKEVTKGQVIENYDPKKLTVDPNPGNVTVVFTVSVQDKGGLWSEKPGTITMPFIVDPAIITGTIYEDNNNDGKKDTNEKGIPNITVTLTGKDDEGKDVKLETKTDDNGNYKFEEVPPGKYTVTETQPAGYLDGKVTPGSGSTKNGESGTNLIKEITVGQGETSKDNNFGELKPATITGIVYEDKNKDGKKDADEKGIPNTTVTLTGTDVNGKEVKLETKTDADGKYKLDNLTPGKYTVNESQPNGYDDGKDTIGTGAKTPGNMTNDKFSDIELEGGNNAVDYNFGEIKQVPAIITGTVYEDHNNNGKKDTDEKGVPNTTITLTGVDDNGNNVTKTTKTDENGNYKFEDVPPGKYTVTEEQPKDYLDGKVTPGSGSTTSGTPDVNKIVEIFVKHGETSKDNNFGELKPASISGIVYEDDNNDGKKDTGEKGIPDAIVTLTGIDINGKEVKLETKTDKDGKYSFNDLTPGNYTVIESQPDGYNDGIDTIGESATKPGTMSNDKFSNIELSSGDNAINYNFGEIKEKPAVITGVIYEDHNNDGKKDTEEKGIPNTTITLTGKDDDGKEVKLETKTDDNGHYKFEDVPPGKYTITESQPKDYLEGKVTPGTGSTKNGDAGTNVIKEIVVKHDETSKDNNFGELKPTSISGIVYDDKNKNGKKDADENGIPNATVILTGKDINGKEVKLETKTDKNGKYSFTELTPGKYTVGESQPKGYDDGEDTIGTGAKTPGNMTNDKFSDIELESGDNAVDYNFGEVVKESTPEPTDPPITTPPVTTPPVTTPPVTEPPVTTPPVTTPPTTEPSVTTPPTTQSPVTTPPVTTPPTQVVTPTPVPTPKQVKHENVTGPKVVTDYIGGMSATDIAGAIAMAGLLGGTATITLRRRKNNK